MSRTRTSGNDRWLNTNQRSIEDWERYQLVGELGRIEPDDVLSDEHDLVERIRARGAIAIEDCIEPTFTSGDGDGRHIIGPTVVRPSPKRALKEAFVAGKVYTGHTNADPAARQEAARLGWIKRRQKAQV